MLPSNKKNKINSMVAHETRCNELHNELLLWFKNKGYDVDLYKDDQILSDILTDAISEFYNSESTINTSENYMLINSKLITKKRQGSYKK